MDQRTDEWFAARLGKVTASRVHDVVYKTKSGTYGAARANYMAELILERLTGSKAEGFTNAAIQWGIDNEDQARQFYELGTDDPVKEVGFVNHPSIDMAGASPDGLVGDAGLIEIKCPNSATHLDFILTDKIKPNYFSQMQWQMACTEREWCDFVSYDPRFSAGLQIRTVRVNRDDEWIENARAEVIKFLDEVDAKIEALKDA